MLRLPSPRPPPRRVATAASASPLPSPAATAPGAHWAEATPSRAQWDALAGAKVTRVDRPADGPVAATAALGGGSAPALLVVARSMGCPFCQELAAALADGRIARLEAAGVAVALVSIGTPARGADFCALTGLPPSNLLADPGTEVYGALGLERGFGAAFGSVTTPTAIARRVAAPGGGASLAAALRKWKPYMPPAGPVQSLNQGGAFAFAPGGDCLWARCDRATADHADPDELVARGLALVQQQ